MKKYIFFAIFYYAATLAAQDAKLPEPYTQEEFPLWANRLRRFEIVLVGTFPITMLVSSLFFDIIENSKEGKGILDSRSVTADSIGSRVLLGVSLSAALSLTDFFIEEERLSKQQQQREELIKAFENEE